MKPLAKPQSEHAHCPGALLAAMFLTLALAGCASLRSAPSAPTPVAVLSAEQIDAIVDSPDRRAVDRINDVRRKPEQMLAFIGVRPGMTALDLSAGGGYTTELIARAVGPRGRVYGQSAPDKPAAISPDAPMPSAPPARMPSPLALAERAKNPAAGNIIAVVRPFDDPVPSAVASNALDLVTFMFNYHDLGHMDVDRAKMNKAVFAALKPGGMYVIADHAGRPGTGISESDTLHRIEESFLRKEVEAAGFVLVEQGDFLRNPDDPRDQNTPQPPQPKDEFVLKFVKPTSQLMSAPPR